ncbi:PLP-dependent aminotransferase family protein [Alkalihalobacillus pseudalcaliphilus]|uniref:aminotransferase-like domain-containing protein n=1 Tax=Alkalihalobacillus pseudalcaliphilus TaxID=79884 RepID=UPI00064DE34E|nr:PLP-dependent aminotransferase family protein [Alkalihalobacillus pseudalcaliphilus]KMK75259.1 GntR family transcriptional regulator [Alkalihalobacillus pseudalcaliphilus]
MSWKPDHSSTISLFQQISIWIVTQIEQGIWPVGTKLPSQRKLAENLRVNRSTIVQVLDELKAEGLLVSKAGSGIYVNARSWEYVVKKSAPDWRTRIKQSYYKSNIQTIQSINEHEMSPQMMRLGTGELSPELIPTKELQEFMGSISITSREFGYSDPMGDRELREVLTRYLHSQGISATPENILIVSGGLQALQLISIGLINMYGKIYCQSPSYLHSLPSLPSEAMNNSQLNKQSSVLYTIPTLNNPSGKILSFEERKRLLEECKKLQLPMIEDGVYQELIFSESPPSIKSMDTDGQVIYIGSVSKILSPGLRVGWMVGPESVMNHLSDLKMQLDYGTSIVSQKIVAAWLKSSHYHQHMSWLRTELKKRADFTEKLLQYHFAELANWETPQGGFYIWLKMKRPVVTKALFQRMLKQNILINPGYIYQPNDYNHIRISYSYCSYQEIEKSLVALADEIRRYL